MHFSLRRMFAFALCWPAFAAAGISVPADARLALNGGALALATQDLRVDGALSLGTGVVIEAGSIRFGSAAQVDLGSGSVELSGDWENRGHVDAGSSDVWFLDGRAQSAILGNTAFADVAWVSASGKRYRFESAHTQTVAGLLRIEGSAAQPVQVDVSQAGVTAYLDLLASGSQAIAHVGVSDVHASGQHLAPTLHNEGGRGNDSGWFGSIDPPPAPVRAVPIPTLSTPWLALLALLLGALALRARRHFSA